jgi:CBS domain-containing protein
VNETREFLARFQPFDRLEPALLERVAASVTERSYPEGEDVLVEDGPPAEVYYVVRSGSMELLHQEEVVDILEPGESFGHPSLLTGLAPAFTVRAHEASVCYLIPPELALEVLGKPAGARFVATSLRERLTRTGHLVHALPQLPGTPITVLLGAPPVFCSPDSTIREAAQAMTDARVSAVLARSGKELGILTEADLREKVVAGPLSPDDLVSAAMTVPTITTPDDRLSIDAMIDMLEAGVRHLPVIGANGEVRGIVAAADFLQLESRSPFALRREIVRARDEDALVEEARGLPKMFVALVDAGLSGSVIGRVLALQSDAATSRLIDLSIARHGDPPAAWAWLALGSVARRELTLASDQDNALGYADGGDQTEVDAYFRRLAEEVNAGLAECGFGPDAAEVLARNAAWRMTESAWVRVFEECFELPDRSHLVRAAVAFDFRQVAGGLDFVGSLVGHVRNARLHPGFLARLARTATDLRPPLGFRGRIAARRAENGFIDIKRGGVVPIANLARFHALANGITISATLDRLTAVEEIGALEPERAQALREAFGIVSKVRLEHHAAQIQRGEAPDNLVHPRDLPPLARLDLREAFRTVAEAQKQLQRYVPLGMS